jgi:GT2 family glycosyltransferase
MVSENSSDVTLEYAVIDDASTEWGDIDWNCWPSPKGIELHFSRHAGLTRSWNAGLVLAAERSADYAVCTNSDVLFSKGWFGPLASALRNGFHLVGPLTNAPGHASWQNVAPFYEPLGSPFSDADEQLDEISNAIRKHLVGPIEAPINGFFMMARTATWFKGALTRDCVFDPHYPLVGNEVELQRRWSRAGFRIGFVPQSYVFHYRSVSRPEGLEGKMGYGAYRPELRSQNAPATKR